MTRPTPTQGAQSEAARVPRVSDAELDNLCLGPCESRTFAALRDLRDERQASRDDRATIADLERRLAEAERRGFEAGRDAAAEAALETYYGAEAAEAIRALAPAVPQEGETTP